jgi:hypothetical protein
VTPTLFGVLWVPVVLVYSWKPVRLLQLAILGSAFQGAAIAASDSYAIASSLLPSLLFLGHGLLRIAATPRSSVERRILRLLLPVLLLTAYATLSSYLLPRLFEGSVTVWPPRGDFSEFHAEALRPARGNITQAFYIIVHVGVTVTAAFLLSSSPRTQALLVRTYIASGFIVLALCVWELTSNLAGVPYPDTFLHSNKTIAILAGSEMGGVKRLSGPFSEASILAMFLSGTLFTSAFLVLNGLRSWAIYALGFGSLLIMLLSTSTTGLLVTGLLLFFILALPFVGFNLPGLRRIGAALVILGFLGLAGVAVLPSAAPQAVEALQKIVDATLQKQHTESFDIRSQQDADSLRVPLDTYGLGAGWGSVRASSLATTLAGGVGIPGLLLCIWFGVSVTKHVAAAKRLPLTAGSRFVIDATSGMLLGNVVAAAISVPDLDSFSFYVLLAALVATVAGAGYESEITPRLSKDQLATLSARVDPRTQPHGDGRSASR